MNHNERNKQYYREKRELLINTLGGKCVICGETNHDLLEFDHINPSSKLTMEQVIEIREKYTPGSYSYSVLASEYGVSKTTIINIVKNRNRVDM